MYIHMHLGLSQGYFTIIIAVYTYMLVAKPIYIVNVAPLNRPLVNSRFPTAVQLPPSADGGCFGKVCRVL